VNPGKRVCHARVQCAVIVPQRIPQRLAHARPLVEQFVEIAKRHNLSRLEATLLFTHHSCAPYVVFGVNTLAELQQVVEVSTHLDLMNIDCVAVVKTAFQNIDRAIVNPSLWSRD